MRFLPRLLNFVIQDGALGVQGPDGQKWAFGNGQPSLWINVHDRSFDWRVFLRPEIELAEAFMDKRISVSGGSIYDVLAVVLQNRPRLQQFPTQKVCHKIERNFRWLWQYNPVRIARKNAGHHYNTGNAFYRMWLDQDMQYSCAYFKTGQETLDHAQTLKKRHIAAKLGLKPGQRVLDIGCGWGGMALYLASVADVEVLGVTLSEEQLQVARDRAQSAGLSHRVKFELRDYREISEEFDRIVSVGMLEHVGIRHLPDYFQQVKRLLNPDGVAMIHSISTIADRGTTGPFLRKYIFPGGCAPALPEITSAVSESRLWVLDIEVWRVHYAKTLHAWRQRFMDARSNIASMYDDRFARMWEFYLAACEASFRFGNSNVVQVQLAKDRAAMPLSRDYIHEASRMLRQREADALRRIEAATIEVFDRAA